MSPGMARVRSVVRSLREGPFTNHGCYPKFFLMSDGETASHAGVRSELFQVLRATRDAERNGWAVVAEDVNWEDTDMVCVITNERIESAYAEDSRVWDREDTGT